MYIVGDGGYKCHFKDVCIQLTKRALYKNNFIEEGDDFEEDEMLMEEWQSSYGSLKSKV